MATSAQSISLLPINGVSFLPGSRVIYEIPADISFIRAARGESYLAFEVRNSGTMRWMFPTSGQSLISRVDISSLASGTSYESLPQYGQVMYQLDQYGQVEHSMKQSTEGMRDDPTALQTFANGATAARLITSDGTPQQVMNSIISPITTTGVAKFNAWKVLVPLRAGIFAAFGPEKLTPILALGGLRIELTLQSESLVCCPISPIQDDNPKKIVKTQTTIQAVTQGGNTSTLVLAGTTVPACEYRPGDVVWVKAAITANDLTVKSYRITSVAQSGADVHIVVDGEAEVTTSGFIYPGLRCVTGAANTEVNVPGTTIESSGLCVGQTVSISGNSRAITAMASQNGIIDPATGYCRAAFVGKPTTPGANLDNAAPEAGVAVTVNGAASVITADVTVVGNVATTFTIDNVGTTALYPGDVLSFDVTTAGGDKTDPTYVVTESDVILTVAAVDITDGNGNLVVTPESKATQCKYAIDSLEYRVQQVFPPKPLIDKLMKGMMYSFRTYVPHYDNIPAGSRRYEVDIPSVTSMGKCLMTHFSSSTYDEDPNMPQFYTGMTPDDLKLNSLQYQINDKRFPLSAYDPRVLQDRPEVYNEIQKAFTYMGTGAYSFGTATGSNLNGYCNTFLACRGLAGANYVYPLRSANPEILLGFSASRDEIVRVNTFVWADKVISIQGSGVSVIL